VQVESDVFGSRNGKLVFRKLRRLVEILLHESGDCSIVGIEKHAREGQVYAKLINFELSEMTIVDTFDDCLNTIMSRGNQCKGGSNVEQHTLHNMSRDVGIERCDDTAELPGGQDYSEDVWMVLADDGDDGLGAIFLVYLNGEPSRDCIEVAIGPVFLATLNHIAVDIARASDSYEGG